MSVDDITPWVVLVVGGGMFLAGLVKGGVGVGFPMVAVPLLASVMPPTTAIALLCVPVVLTNLSQFLAGGRHREAVRRFWPLGLGILMVGPVGVHLMTGLETGTLLVLVGCAIILFCGQQLLPVGIRVPAGWEPWTTPVAGVVSGFVGGITGFFGPLPILYLMALGVGKEAFVTTMAMVFLSASGPLYGTLAAHGIVTGAMLVVSAGGTVLAFAGMAGGTWARNRIPEATFRRTILLILLLIGANLIRKGLAPDSVG